MKKILLFFTAMCIGTFFSLNSYACINSNCKSCPDGFSRTEMCCKRSDREDCAVLDKDKEETCGIGQWKEYPRFGGGATFPFHKCCKDWTSKDCIEIKPKGICGHGELAEYISQVRCCNEDFSECVEYRECPECASFSAVNKDRKRRMNR